MSKQDDVVERIKQYLLSEGAISEGDQITSASLSQCAKGEEKGPLVKILNSADKFRDLTGFDFIVYEQSELIDRNVLWQKFGTYYGVIFDPHQKSVSKVKYSSIRRGVAVITTPSTIDEILVYKTNQRFVDRIASHAEELF